jgi:hypothetical protein
VKANQLEANDSSKRDSYPYSSVAIAEYGQEFMSYVDPYFVKDIEDNLQWYL